MHHIISSNILRHSFCIWFHTSTYGIIVGSNLLSDSFGVNFLSSRQSNKIIMDWTFKVLKYIILESFL